MIARLPAILTVLVVLALDVIVKRWAERSLAPGVPVPILDAVVQWRLGYNPGIAFGLFPTGDRLWLILTAVGVVGLTVWFALLLASRPSPFAAVPLGLMLGGALANLLDRWADSRVTDVLDVGIGTTRWPVFNLADTALTLGVIGLLARALREDRRSRRVGES